MFLSDAKAPPILFLFGNVIILVAKHVEWIEVDAGRLVSEQVPASFANT